MPITDSGVAMRLRFARLVGLIGLAGSGCFTTRPSQTDSFVHIAARNEVQQSIRPHDDNDFAKRMRKLAESAFAMRGVPASEAFHDGFVEGFVDYIEAGGTGEPPYLPPFRYRLTEHRTPEGLAAIRDWYAGFREGSGAAKASGLRELNYIPLPGPAVPADHSRSVDPPLTGAKLGPPFAAERSPWELPGDLPRPTMPETGPSPRPVLEPPKLPVAPVVPDPVKPGTLFAPPIDVSARPANSNSAWQPADSARDRTQGSNPS
jgi:hypothetical protein